MYPLFESIKILNGAAQYLEFHQRRIDRTLLALFGKTSSFDLEKIIKVPDVFSEGIVKAKVIYDIDSILDLVYSIYDFKKVTSYQLVKLDQCDYPFKYLDRTCLDKAYAQRKACDDIIIAVNGLITDSYYANLVFKDHQNRLFTPEGCLLPGTKRERYLFESKLLKKKISIETLQDFTHVCRINAMIDLGEDQWVKIIDGVKD